MTAAAGKASSTRADLSIFGLRLVRRSRRGEIWPHNVNRPRCLTHQGRLKVSVTLAGLRGGVATACGHGPDVTAMVAVLTYVPTLASTGTVSFRIVGEM